MPGWMSIATADWPGTVLGIRYGTPEKWSAPLGDLLETYLKGKEKLSISELARRTYEMSIKG